MTEAVDQRRWSPGEPPQEWQQGLSRIGAALKRRGWLKKANNGDQKREWCDGCGGVSYQ